MTLQQLKYVTAIADCGSMNEAAKTLFSVPAEPFRCGKRTGGGSRDRDFQADEQGRASNTGRGRVSWLREAAAQPVRTVGGSLYPENAGKEKIQCVDAALFVCGKSVCRAGQAVWHGCSTNLLYMRQRPEKLSQMCAISAAKSESSMKMNLMGRPSVRY